MNKGLVTKILPHFIAVVVFATVALIYCKPALEGKVLQQPDIIHWKGMAQNSFEFRDQHGHLPLWTNGMFSGMPAYQISMEPDVAVTPAYFYGLFSLYLPKPIGFFFTGCICFYFLALVLGANPYIAIIGGLTYAYATYNPAYLAAGHDTKIMTIMLLPGFIASIILVFEKKYWWGAALTAIFTALMIGLNHMQIVYYGLIIAVFMSIGYAVYWFKRNQLKHFLIASAILVASGVIGVLGNAVTLLTTLDVSKRSIRGGTELADENTSAKGLSKDYAMSYSMGILEPFVMLVPDMFGGSGQSIFEKKEDTKTAEALGRMPQELSRQLEGAATAYWGGIAPVPPAAPNYIGAMVVFLALLGFFVLDSKHKWWMLGATVLSILMSWGSYFEGFNSLLLDILPGYNKFRVPSMIIVIPTLLFMMLAMMTLQKLVGENSNEDYRKQFKKGLLLTGSVFAVLFMIYFGAGYQGSIDKELLKQAGQAGNEVMQYVRSFLSALKEDRQSVFLGSLMKSLFLVALAAGMIWLAIRKKAADWIVLGVIGLVTFIDLMSLDAKYLDADKYVDEDEYEANFQMTPADQKIKQDTSFYRVFDLRQGFSTLTYGALTSYHHKSIGGYHPAKLSIYQDLIEHQLSKINPMQLPSNVPALNMLNTKYIIVPGDSVMVNNGNLGAAWFVKGIRFEKDARSVMNALTDFSPADTAILFASDEGKVSATADSNATIRLISNLNDVVTYESNSSAPGFAVFSEVYYDLGWKAYIDDQETPIYRTNYVLRGIQVPAGKHNIRFEFRPASYYGGEKIALAAGILIMLILAAAIFQSYRDSRKVKA